MAKLVYLWHAARFWGLLGKRKVFLKYGNFLVYMHFHLTSRSSTDDTLREIILENLRQRIRRNDQYTYTIWTKAFSIAVEKMGVELVNPHKNNVVTDDLLEPELYGEN